LFDKNSIPTDSIAILRYGVPQILGTNLFEPHKSLDFSKCAGPTKLLESHGAKEPGLYIVAADTLSFQEGPQLLKQQRFFIVTDSSPTQTNHSSICTMVIFASKEGKSVLPVIKHFAGGDCPEDVEIKVLRWANNVPATKVDLDISDVTRNIPVVKLGHHGSAKTTSKQLIEGCNPTTVIIPAGPSNSHRHPAWETIVYLDAFYSQQALSLPRNRSQYFLPLIGLCYPPWLRTNSQHHLRQVSIPSLNHG
jgi:hypothetical protein